MTMDNFIENAIRQKNFNIIDWEKVDDYIYYETMIKILEKNRTDLFKMYDKQVLSIDKFDENWSVVRMVIDCNAFNIIPEIISLIKIKDVEYLISNIINNQDETKYNILETFIKYQVKLCGNEPKKFRTKDIINDLFGINYLECNVISSFVLNCINKDLTDLDKKVFNLIVDKNNINYMAQNQIYNLYGSEPPLHLAINFSASKELINLLLENGANIYQCNFMGLSTFDLANYKDYSKELNLKN
jgi:hypothetical protein